MSEERAAAADGGHVPCPRLTLHAGGCAADERACATPRVGPGQAPYEPGEPRDGYAPAASRADAAARPRRGAGDARGVERARVAALDDLALVRAMRAEDPWAWSQFYARFRPILAEMARRVRLPDGAATTAVDALVDEVLADEAGRLTAPNAPQVGNLAGYLVRAARHKLANVRRAASRRQRWYAEAARHDAVGGTVAVVDGLCSEHLLRIASGVVREPDADDAAAADAADAAAADALAADALAADALAADAAAAEVAAARGRRRAAADADTPSAGVLALAAAVRAGATEEEQLLLALVAEGTSHRMIAAWLGVSYDAATKRIWRLCRKLRAAALRRVSHLGAEERAEVERFLRRAGALPALVATVSPAAARQDFPRTPFDDGEGAPQRDRKARGRRRGRTAESAERTDTSEHCDE